MGNLINYQLAKKGFKPRLEGGMYTYILAANGVFVYSKNDYFEAMVPIKWSNFQRQEDEIRGLESVKMFFKIRHLIPAEILSEIVGRSFNVLPNEALFFLKANPVSIRVGVMFYDDIEWEVLVPEQKTTQTSVQAKKDYPYTPVEIHSHNTMDAFFSLQDNREETGMRIYAVLGKLIQEPVDIVTRVSIYGHAMEIPYMDVFEPCGFVKDVIYAI